VPARSLNQQATQDRPRDRGSAACRAEDAECAIALRSLGERPGKNGERVRCRQRGTETLARTRCDQPAECAGQSPGQRRRGQHGDTGHEYLAVTSEVACAAAQHQEARHNNAVDDHHPLEVGRAGMKARLDGGQSHIDHGQVDHGHRHYTAHQGENGTLGQRTGRCHVVASSISCGSNPPPVLHQVHVLV
jgi:hypothetical protein